MTTSSTGSRIYGCDDCLAACPWNKFAQEAREMRLQARPALQSPRLADLAALDDAAFRALFAKSPVKRIGRDRLMRNVLYAIGNSDDPSLIAPARALLDDPAPLVRGAAVWALAAATFALTIGPSAHWTTHWLAPALLTGVAIGLTLPVQSGAAVAALPAARFGLGSAINASFRQLGAVLGVSLFVALIGDTRTATVTDYRRTWWILGAIGLTSGLILLLPRLAHARPHSDGAPPVRPARQ